MKRRAQWTVGAACGIVGGWIALSVGPDGIPFWERAVGAGVVALVLAWVIGTLDGEDF